jgi:hypothetical protein
MRLQDEYCRVLLTVRLRPDDHNVDELRMIHLIPAEGSPPVYKPKERWEGVAIKGPVHDVELILDPYAVSNQAKGNSQSRHVLRHWHEMVNHLWVVEAGEEEAARGWFDKRLHERNLRVARLFSSRRSFSAWDPANPAQATANLIDVVLSSIPGRALIHCLLLSFSNAYVQVVPFAHSFQLNVQQVQ